MALVKLTWRPENVAPKKRTSAPENIAVPAAFTPGQLQRLEDRGDPRLAQAVAGRRDGQVIQYPADAPELLAPL